jgi:hypothetical protein
MFVLQFQWVVSLRCGVSVRFGYTESATRNFVLSVKKIQPCALYSAAQHSSCSIFVVVYLGGNIVASAKTAQSSMSLRHDIDVLLRRRRHAISFVCRQAVPSNNVSLPRCMVTHLDRATSLAYYPLDWVSTSRRHSDRADGESNAVKQCRKDLRLHCTEILRAYRCSVSRKGV